MIITIQNSLLIGSILYLYSFVITMYLLRKYSEIKGPLLFFGFFFLFNALGQMGIFFRADIPQFVSVIIANTLLVLAPLMLLQSITLLSRIDSKKVFSVLILSFFVASFIVFTYISPNVQVRVIIYGLTISVVFINIIVTGIKNSIENKVTDSLFFLILISYLGIHIYRSIFAALSFVPSNFLEYKQDAFNILLMAIVGNSLLFGILVFYNSLYKKQLSTREDFMRLIVKNIPTPAFLHKNNKEIISVSQTLLDVTGYKREQLTTIDEWVELAYGDRKAAVIEVIERLYLNKDETVHNLVNVRKSDLTERAWSFHSRYIGDLENGEEMALSVALDITDLLDKERKLQEIVITDYLTKLYNRRHFEDCILDSNEELNLPYGVVMADINGLKLINDAFGHEKGDLLLEEATNVFKKVLKGKGDIFRIGGDEFAFTIKNTSAEEIEKLLNEVVEEASKIYINSIQLSIAFGYTIKEKVTEDIYTVINDAEDKMYREKIMNIPSMRSSALDGIMNTLYEKDIYSSNHSKNVSEYAERFAQVLKLNRAQITEIKTAGILHDIGKIIIPTDIIQKEGKLTEAEMDIIRSHPEIGYRILYSTSEMRSVSNIVLHHHEKWDGTGYPLNIQGDNIPLSSRIICIADAFDAMTSDRLYRDKFSIPDAIEELKRCAGTQFDKKLVNSFIKHIDKIVLSEKLE